MRNKKILFGLNKKEVTNKKSKTDDSDDMQLKYLLSKTRKADGKRVPAVFREQVVVMFSLDSVFE
ncbi:hypothetical protein ACWN8V_04925 [Vagococcus elongatus]|uniref:Uncharacterized protein n=1 Tax=Vagococcus elongatus TaxID=180344 RepID=A0A430ARP2_9ENTE|nr:hypothetical protein [Vagococcus elongatus]RSU10729.1 hypothetical protein CBF29_09090 [Vagococcus elongatus]